ncbi:hypothetical protein OOJ91_13565 [Micromonospora lupini]|uniref:hypothetical protein n=1 Tax=Micromonospora lupini TaxID=285679 RepID=UPI00225BEA96|nr:hypothetical protein [Micromonospora lupini]MCX5066874.1 hypothetical protein [Micromonospora lupini]
MHIVQRLRRLLTSTPPRVPPGTGQRYQTVEQEAAKARLIALAHHRAGGRHYDGPTR